jgi:phosphocarrier protein HPr
MLRRTVTINKRPGLHLKPAASIVSLAQRFRSEIRLIRDNRIANGKSIMGVLGLEAEYGARLTIEAEGQDETEAMEALVELVNNNFELSKDAP